MTWRIKNWSEYQHYKDRDPPWIKLHRNTLTSRTWVSLDNDGRALAVACMLIAAGTENQIPDDLGFIKRRAYFDKTPDLSPLVKCGFLERCENKNVADASTDASKREQTLSNDRPEGEAEKRQRREEAEIDSSAREFAELCRVFPKQRIGNKAKNFSAYKSARKRDSPANILLGARGYADSDEVREGFAKGLAAWLNDDRWRVDYQALRKRTADDMREEFLHGDQGDDLGSGTIDGECVEVAEPGSQDDGRGVAPGAEGSDGRGREAGNGSPAVELEQVETADTGGLEDACRRVEAIAQAAARPTVPNAYSRGDLGQDPPGHLPREGDPGVRSVGQAPEEMDARGATEGEPTAGGTESRDPQDANSGVMPEIPKWMDRRSSRKGAR